MTHAAARRRRGTPWALPVLGLLVMWTGVLAGFISRSIVVDFLSWWPVWLAIAGAGFLLRGRRIGKFKLSGFFSLGSVVVLALFLAGHLQGWPLMPSATEEVAGVDDSGVATAAISVRTGNGDLRVEASDTGPLYQATAIRAGGSTGLPVALERAQGDQVSVDISPTENPGFYQFAGWELLLSPAPTWGVSLQGSIDADLLGIRMENLQLEGSGTVRLGPVETGVPLSVAGDFHIVVPAGNAVRVIGPAEVPGDWIRNESGILSPTEGDGWIISVANGAVVRITER